MLFFQRDKKRKARSSSFELSSRAPQPGGSPKHIVSFILLWLLAVCKVGGLFILYLVQIECRWCHLLFCVCRRCFRGQAYCSDECRIAGRRKNHREAQRRYRQTLKGKKAHCEAENRRRHGLSRKNEKKMDDPSSTRLPSWCMELLFYAHLIVLYARAWFDKTGRCHFCGNRGVIVDRFPRRGYGDGSYKVQMV